MAFAIDEEKINAPDMQVMDPAKPPIKEIAYQPFPKMVYLHPKDKSKEHITMVVHDQHSLDNAVKQGYRTTPHIPENPSLIPLGFEADIPEPEVKRKTGIAAAAANLRD